MLSCQSARFVHLDQSPVPVWYLFIVAAGLSPSLPGDPLECLRSSAFGFGCLLKIFVYMANWDPSKFLQTYSLLEVCECLFDQDFLDWRELFQLSLGLPLWRKLLSISCMLMALFLTYKITCVKPWETVVNRRERESEFCYWGGEDIVRTAPKCLSLLSESINRKKIQRGKGA